MTNEVQKDVDSSADDVDAPCQPDAVIIDGQNMCASALQDSTKPTSTTNTDVAHNDSYYVNEGADTANLSSPVNSLSSPTNPTSSPTQQPINLVAIYIPYDDSSMATIAEDQGNSDNVCNHLLRDTAAVDNAQNAGDVKEVETSDGKQLQSHGPTMEEVETTSKVTVKVCSLSDDTVKIPDTDTMATKESSPVISSLDDTPPPAQKIRQPKPYSVTIDIPPHDSGAMPTLAKDTGIHDQYVNPSCHESIKLQRNPAYVTISDERCSTGTIDEVKLQTNPAYIPTNHTSSEIQWYEVIPCTTAPIASTSSSIGDAAIKLEKNPAYHTINYAKSLL